MSKQKIGLVGLAVMGENSEYVNQLYGVNIAYSAKLFQFKQKRWELYKRCVITCDRLLGRATYKLDQEADLVLLRQKLKHILATQTGKSIKLP